MEIKGIKEGLLIILEERDWQEARHNLISQIEVRRDFFQGADLVLDLGKHVLGAIEIAELRDQLSYRGVVLKGILSPFSVTQDAVHCLGLLTKLKTQQVKSNILMTHVDTVLSSDDLQKLSDRIVEIISDYLEIDRDRAEISIIGQGIERSLILNIPLGDPKLQR